jgi:hypothetical protein
LTPSGQCVARLAAQGLSTPRLANRLYLSTKTVESHLTRIYRKLDISRRSELGEDMVTQDVPVDVRDLMPRLRQDLETLVRIPSVSVPGRIDPPLLEAFELTSRLFADAGVNVGRLDLPDTAPVVTGEIPPPPGAPTVLLYSHYDTDIP